MKDNEGRGRCKGGKEMYDMDENEKEGKRDKGGGEGKKIATGGK